MVSDARPPHARPPHNRIVTDDLIGKHWVLWSPSVTILASGEEIVDYIITIETGVGGSAPSMARHFPSVTLGTVKGGLWKSRKSYKGVVTKRRHIQNGRGCCLYVATTLWCQYQHCKARSYTTVMQYMISIYFWYLCCKKLLTFEKNRSMQRCLIKKYNRIMQLH